MTPIEALLRRQIEATGPVTLAEYMALCLSHPEHGYYITHDPFGKAGDFVTAPEISQMFGELLGLALAQAWVEQGSPSPFILAELGPGSGQLMSDAMRAASRAPGFVEAADLWLVETSPVLRAEQAKLLPQPSWADSIDDLPDGPLFLVANEFFDALPIRQYHLQNGRWRETVVGVEDDKLSLGLKSLPEAMEDAPDGAIRERCPSGEAFAGAIAKRIADHGGTAIIVDYGYDQPIPEGADTFQAVREHAYVDPLSHPGTADLTAHVNFGALAKAAHDMGAVTSQLIAQGDFLYRLGIGARAASLARAAPDQLDNIEAALKRLTHVDEMGSLFKTLAIYPVGAPPPPGFESRTYGYLNADPDTC